MPLIPVGERYSASTSSSKFIEVLCDHCQKKYYFEIEVTGHGGSLNLLWWDSDGAKEAAQFRAYEDAERKLETASTDSPYTCPYCGYYTERETERKKSVRESTAILEGIFFGIISFWIWLSLDQYNIDLSQPFNVAIMAGIIVVAVFIPLIQNMFPYDPNKSAEKRKGKKQSQDYPVYSEFEYLKMKLQVDLIMAQFMATGK